MRQAVLVRASGTPFNLLRNGTQTPNRQLRGGQTLATTARDLPQSRRDRRHRPPRSRPIRVQQMIVFPCLRFLSAAVLQVRRRNHELGQRLNEKCPSSLRGWDRRTRIRVEIRRCGARGVKNLRARCRSRLGQQEVPGAATDVTPVTGTPVWMSGGTGVTTYACGASRQVAVCCRIQSQIQPR